MLVMIKEFFTKELDTDKTASKQTKLQQACAGLLLEVMRADFDQTEQEKEKIQALLQSTFDLSDPELNALMEYAEQGGKDTTSMYPFTSLINEHYDYDKRVNLIQLMWKVAYADGNLDKYEDSIIRKVAELMYIRHSDFIKAKLAEEQRH
jgi:uncharacterized tellurite resistance protein B-like protein